MEQELIYEIKDKFFVYTKGRRAPHYAHDTHASALAEAERLAKHFPGRKFIVQHWLEKVSLPQGSNKEPNMQKQYWIGTKDDQVSFAHSEDALKNQGITSTSSFTVNNNELSGVSFIDDEQQVGSQQTQTPQTA